MTGVRIGELRQRVRLETATSTPDGGGGGAESWVLVAELWAAVKPLAGQSGLRRTRSRAASRTRFSFGIGPA